MKLIAKTQHVLAMDFASKVAVSVGKDGEEQAVIKWITKHDNVYPIVQVMENLIWILKNVFVVAIGRDQIVQKVRQISSKIYKKIVHPSKMCFKTFYVVWILHVQIVFWIQLSFDICFCLSFVSIKSLQRAYKMSGWKLIVFAFIQKFGRMTDRQNLLKYSTWFNVIIVVLYKVI